MGFPMRISQDLPVDSVPQLQACMVWQHLFSCFLKIFSGGQRPILLIKIIFFHFPQSYEKGRKDVVFRFPELTIVGQ